MSIEQDVEAARRGDVVAYGRLVERTQAMARAVARRVLRGASDADDVVQDAYVIAFRRLDALEEAEAFPGWLRRIVVTRALNARRSHRGTFVTLDPELDVPVLDEREERWTEGQRLALASALASLSRAERRLCDRRHHGGWSVARLAAHDGVSEAAMRKRLQRIRDRLREEIEMREKDPSDTSSHDVASLPDRVVELLARPDLVDLPENPVAETLAVLEDGLGARPFEGELPDVVDLDEAERRLGRSPVYIPEDSLHFVDARRVLRYDLTLPLLLALRLDGEELRVSAAGKVYRRESESATHLEAFHQAELFVGGRHAALEPWVEAGRILGALASALPGRAVRVEPTRYPFCTEAWHVAADHEGAWVELLAWGVYAPWIIEALGGDPERDAALGAGLGLERIAALRHGIDDIRRLASTRLAG